MEKEKEADEERLLKNMENYETIQKEKDELVEQCKEEEKVFLKNQEEMLTESTQFDAEEKELKSKRDLLTGEIDPRYLGHYNKILQHKGGPAVVQIVDSNCRGCHMTLPPQLFNDVRKGTSIITCSFCNRILYVENQICQKES
jgi:predicted  nucleic acid-binding Zn-ribbon protein